MDKIVSDISEKEELELVSKGIDKLLADGIEHTRGNILEIMAQYPSVKKERFADEQFKQTVFDAMKKRFDVGGHSFAYNFGFRYEEVVKYCEQFPFLAKMMLADKELQMKLKEFVEYVVGHLVESSKYGDEESNQHPQDRMSALWVCESLYASRFVSKETKKSNLP